MSSLSFSKNARRALEHDVAEAVASRTGLSQQDAREIASRMMQSVIDTPAGGDGSETGLPISSIMGTWGKFPHQPVPVMCWPQENWSNDWRANAGHLLTLTLTLQQQRLLGFEIVRAERGDRHDLEAAGYHCPPPQPGEDEQPKLETPDHVLRRVFQLLSEANDDARALAQYIADNPSLADLDWDDDGEGWKRGKGGAL